MEKEKQTRAEYRKSLGNQTEVSDETLSRSNQKQNAFNEQRFNPDEQSEVKSRNLAKKLNIAIAGLVIGIILVFLILFFVG